MLVRAWKANPSAAERLVRSSAHTAIARPCLVDLGTKRVERFLDRWSGRLIELEVVDDVSCGGCLPMELLILEP